MKTATTERNLNRLARLAGVALLSAAFSAHAFVPQHDAERFPVTHHVSLITQASVTPLLSDAFGNVVASVTNGTSVVWNPTRVGGYGPLPGSSAAWLSTNTTLAAATVWRGKRMDPTGYYWMGARYYDPTGGRFLSPDPLGHDASMDLYSYADGDPINECDPDGRFGKGATTGATLGDYGKYENTAQAVGGFFGQLGAGLIPWYGQAADVRDFSAALNDVRKEGFGWRTGASVVLGGVAFVPLLGDAAKGLLKPLLRAKAQTARVLGATERMASKTINGAGDELVSLYRAVSPEEFTDVFKIEGFRPKPGGGSLVGKQFGHELDEVVKLADHLPDAAAVIEVRIPRRIFDQLDHTPVDTTILRSGSSTVQPDQLNLFNESIIDLLHAF